ncbi:MAG: HesA/MoeB/ThiF family protein [Betaproteobacteria bacterium]|nr:HesA/MoeB/ThiF family protein [Betaproteobacteria bacterium]
MEDSARLRYSRHLLLPSWDEHTQQRLLGSHVLIVGLGGLGSPAALYLAAAGIGQLTLCDPDEVELTNLQRQIALSHADIGQYKVVATAQRLSQLNPTLQLHLRPESLTQDNASTLLDGIDLVLDCSDNFATRFLLNTLCYGRRIPLVSGAVIRFRGQLTTFDFRHPGSPCYACLFPPEVLQEEEERCALMGVFSPLAGLIGTWQAGEAIKLLGEFGTSLVGRLWLLDGETSMCRELVLHRDPGCSVCGVVDQEGCQVLE